MEVVTLTDNVGVLTGKLLISCIPAIEPTIIQGDLRIVDAGLAVREAIYPALVYGIPLTREADPQLADKVWKLFREGKIGILVTEYEARAIYKSTRRKADGIVLYGDEKFWQAVGTYIESVLQGFRAEEVIAIAKLFRGHVAALRVFFQGRVVKRKLALEKLRSMGASPSEIERAEAEYIEELLNALIRGLPVYSNYPIAGDWDTVLAVMNRNNYEYLNRIEVPPRHKLREVSLEFTVPNIGIGKALKILHPNAVELVGEDRVRITGLF